MDKILNVVKGALLAGATVVAMMFAAGPSVAEDGYTGFSIGIIGNDSTFETAGREEEQGGIPGTVDHNHKKISKDVSFPSLFVEYSWGETIGMTIGVEHIPGSHTIGSGSRTDNATDHDGKTDDAGTRTAKAEVSNITTVYFEPGLFANDMFGIYAKVGGTHLKVKTIETLPSSTYGNKNIWGGMYGIGIKAVSPMGIFVKLEGTHTEFATLKFSSGGSGGNSVKAKPEYDSVRLAIGYNF